MEEFFSFLGWVIGVVFFIWFGCTLAAINNKLGVLVEKALEDQREIATAGPTKACGKCGVTIPASAVYCSYCGKS